MTSQTVASPLEVNSILPFSPYLLLLTKYLLSVNNLLCTVHTYIHTHIHTWCTLVLHTYTCKYVNTTQRQRVVSGYVWCMYDILLCLSLSLQFINFSGVIEIQHVWWRWRTWWFWRKGTRPRSWRRKGSWWTRSWRPWGARVSFESSIESSNNLGSSDLWS